MLSASLNKTFLFLSLSFLGAGARCSSLVRAFAHGAMGRRIDPSWSGPIDLFLVFFFFFFFFFGGGGVVSL